MGLKTGTTNNNASIKLTPEMEAKIIEREDLMDSILKPAKIGGILGIKFTTSTRGIIRKAVKVVLESGTEIETIEQKREHLTKLECFGNLTRLEAFGYSEEQPSGNLETFFLFTEKPKAAKAVAGKK